MAERGARILVIDDDSIVDLLRDAGLEVAGVRELDGEVCDVVIADLDKVERYRPGQLVVLLADGASIERAVDAVHAGAYDFVIRPVRAEILVLTVERALREHAMQRELARLRRHLGIDDPRSAPMSLHELERAYIRRVIQMASGNISEAARILGIDRRTIYRKLS
jgi:DNA-binding NtrC family response regulator